ncbi:MAG: hypothetical protein N2D54_12900 [Chloroflexota bacterium]
MSYQTYFNTPTHQNEKTDLPLLSSLIDRYTEEAQFEDVRVVVGHLLVRNTMAVVEALLVGGAELILSEGHLSPASQKVITELRGHDIPVLPVSEAVQQGDIYIDVNALLGRVHIPTAAAEVTRTGVMHYQNIPCPVVSADDCKSKKIEGFFGTGDGFVRAWNQFHPPDPIIGKHIVQFGYGKIGRGAAHQTRAVGAHVTVVEVDEAAKMRAGEDGFAVVNGQPNPELEKALADAEIVIAVTSVPKILSKTIPASWLRANQPVLVNLGAEDEFGENFSDDEILGGKQVPLNFHLANPTQNKYIDAPLAAHIMALEALVKGNVGVGIHPLPIEMDDWLLKNWRTAWPDENLTGIGPELGLI